MDEQIYQAMLQGLKETIIEKEVVFGEADAKEGVLNILDLLEDLDQFWNNEEDLDPNASVLETFIEETRKKYSSEVKQDG